MLWSVMPENIVFYGADDNLNLMDGSVGDCACRLRVGADGAFAIERLNSTDPKLYLRNDLQPGRRIFIPK